MLSQASVPAFGIRDEEEVNLEPERNLRERPKDEEQHRPIDPLAVLWFLLLLLFAVIAGSSIVSAFPFSIFLPDEEGSWTPSEHVSGRVPAGDSIVTIPGVGKVSCEGSRGGDAPAGHLTLLITSVGEWLYQDS